MPAWAADAVRAPEARVSANETGSTAPAIFAGGCFWGIEGVFSHVRGVKSVVSGYHGGARSDATYARVGTGTTGHAEAVRVRYDPSVVSYGQLLRVFFSVGLDPTQVDRQGPDRGPQYRSALVPLDAGQRKAARAYLDQLAKAGLWSRPIATRIEDYKRFYPAEKQHQDYMLHNPDSPYIRAHDAPKVRALKRLYPANWTARFIPG